MKKLTILFLILSLLLISIASAEYKVPGDDVAEYVRSNGYYISEYDLSSDSTVCSLNEYDDSQLLSLILKDKMCYIKVSFDDRWTNYEDIRALFYDLVSIWQWDRSCFCPEDDGENLIPVSHGLLESSRPRVDFSNYDEYVQALRHALQTTPAPAGVIIQSESYKRMKETMEGTKTDTPEG